MTAKGTDAESLDGINAVVAYMPDLVCSDIVTGVGDGEQIRIIHEDPPGFDLAITRLEALPTFNRRWRDGVILQPSTTTEPPSCTPGHP